jgi:hypothetical protein
LTRVVRRQSPLRMLIAMIDPLWLAIWKLEAAALLL